MVSIEEKKRGACRNDRKSEGKVFSLPAIFEGVEKGGKPCARESRARLDTPKIDNLYGKFSTCELGMWMKPHALPLCRMNV